MTAGIRAAAAAHALPVVVAGAGPAGSATAIGVHRAGQAVRVFEARGEVATRARNIFLRPQARDILEDLTGVRYGRDTTIRNVEQALRSTAAERGVPISYHHRVLDVVEESDHVLVRVQRDGADTVEQIRARAFVDASGGRIEATNQGALRRVPTGPDHVYVTAQYDTPWPHRHVSGIYDRTRNESIFFFPTNRGRGVIAYYDLPVGRPLGDEAALLARYDAIAGQLQLGTPLSPPQAFNARQHVSANAASGRILKIGDAAGNADPYIGAGVAAALVDARAATRALTQPGDAVALARSAAEDVLAGHRSLGRQAGIMVRARDVAMRVFPDASFDAGVTRADVQQSRALGALADFLTSRPI